MNYYIDNRIIGKIKRLLRLKHISSIEVDAKMLKSDTISDKTCVKQIGAICTDSIHAGVQMIRLLHLKEECEKNEFDSFFSKNPAKYELEYLIKLKYSNGKSRNITLEQFKKLIMNITTDEEKVEITFVSN